MIVRLSLRDMLMLFVGGMSVFCLARNDSWWAFVFAFLAAIYFTFLKED